MKNSQSQSDLTPDVKCPRPLAPKPRQPSEPLARQPSEPPAKQSLVAPARESSIAPARPCRNSRSGCYVLICPHKRCLLRSHHRPALCVTETRTRPNNTASAFRWTVNLSRGLLTEFSFADARMNDKEFKNLFHQYLSFDMPRIVALMAPPSLLQSPGQSIKTKTQGIAHLGSLAPVYFLLFVSMAHILELVRRQQLEPDRISAKIYGRLMRVLREKLNDYKPSEVPDLVLSVLALSSFDMSLGQHAAVDHHRAALQQLVSHVGLHALGRSTPYVLSWDRLIAAYTAKPPLYAKMPDLQFLREPRHRIKYGMGFSMYENQLDLDPEVHQVCDHLCRAVEIVEAEEWTFRPERLYRPYSASDINYLYFLRDVIQNTCVILQSSSLHNASKSKPILLAAMIIQYIVLGKNDLTWYSTSAADRLYTELAQQDLEAEWRGCEDALCWLMCVLIAVPEPWKWRPMALELFNNWLEHSHRDTCGSPEVETNLCDPEMFIWSKPDFDHNLLKTLSNLRERNSRDATRLMLSGIAQR